MSACARACLQKIILKSRHFNRGALLRGDVEKKKEGVGVKSYAHRSGASAHNLQHWTLFSLKNAHWTICTTGVTIGESGAIYTNLLLVILKLLHFLHDLWCFFTQVCKFKIKWHPLCFEISLNGCTGLSKTNESLKTFRGKWSGASKKGEERETCNHICEEAAPPCRVR